MAPTSLMIAAAQRERMNGSFRSVIAGVLSIISARPEKTCLRQAGRAGDAFRDR